MKPITKSNLNLCLYAIILTTLITLGCSTLKNFQLGYTPSGLPITLAISGEGEPNITFGESISTPIGTFSLSYNAYSASAMHHRTYIELLSNNDKKKYVFELLDIGESVKWESEKCTTRVENRKFCTVVTVESEEISNLLHKPNEAGTKPSFPEQSFAYFWLTKKLNKNVNWEIKSIGDFFADIFFGILWIFCVFIDIIIIIFSFIIRFFWWLIKLIGYLFT